MWRRAYRNRDREASIEGILGIETPRVHRLLCTPSNTSTIQRTSVSWSRPRFLKRIALNSTAS
ncbi:hypothetical protein COLO4_03090 [Corchorus olitorius]|uniref:Uncharacterized protein n=1 Tax=Corchorus olitorius TaxID=93759 RepID=A0A1R3KZI2_9ROSI|nr:hypothetical protein COLO4_03090 [Corchorus olitorius]